jgi:CubicO group peptidase (beta-lactamase class C family)
VAAPAAGAWQRRGWQAAAVVLAVALTGCSQGRTVPQIGPIPAGQISSYLDGLSAQGRLSGAVMITRGGMSYSAAFGLADRQARTPNSVRTAFRLGSVSKQFTAMGVLMLQARHRLNVSDRICRYLPGCPGQWQQITIEQLLTHTSGIPDYLNDAGARWPPAPATPRQLIAGFRNDGLHFRPGTRMEYSNSGYVLLGALIERLTGQSLAVFLERNVFGPLGMTGTGADTTEIRPGHAHGYYADRRPPVAYPLSAFFADGDLYSTVADMQRWDNAVQQSSLIPAALTRQMFTVHVACPPPGSPGGCLRAADLGYGYGWFIDSTAQGMLYQHVGHIDGFLSFNGIYPASGEHIIILANSESTNVLAIANALASLTLRPVSLVRCLQAPCPPRSSRRSRPRGLAFGWR